MSANINQLKYINTTEGEEFVMGVTQMGFAYVPGTDNWKIAAVTVTPEMAERLLENNTKNRKLRKQVVVKYASIMKKNNWLLSPESIAFDPHGVLLNGQHRLYGIIQSNMPQSVLLVLNVASEIFKVLDRGAVRSTSDALEIPKKAAEVARIMARVHSGQVFHNSVVTDGDIGDMFAIIDDCHVELMETCRTARKVFSTAGIRTAACLHLLAGNDPEYVHTTYRALIKYEFENMSPVAQAFYKYVDNNKLSGGSETQIELLMRGWMIFNSANRDLTRMTINSTRRKQYLDEIRAIIISSEHDNISREEVMNAAGYADWDDDDAVQQARR